MTRFHSIFPPLLLLAATLTLAACAQTPESSSQNEDSGLFIRGTARVISVSPALGLTVLEIDGRRVDAYWQVETTLAQGGLVSQESTLAAPVGHYVEPTVRQQDFAASPGDTIAFVGMKTGKQIYLRGIQVLAH